MKKESGYLWRPVVGVLAIGVLAFGLSLQGAALHQRGVVSWDQVVASAPIKGTLAAAKEVKEVEEPGGKVTGHFAAMVEGEAVAMLVVEDPTAEAKPGDRGDRADDCDPREYASGDDCADITNPAHVLGRTCSVSTSVPCLFDEDCPGTETCQTGNIVYLTGDIMLATRQGQCSASTLGCEYDDECPEGLCETTTTGCHSDADCDEGICSTSGLPCHTTADCSSTNGSDVCEGGRACIGGEFCDNLPCSLSPRRRCTTEPPGGEQPTGFDCVPGGDDCEPPRVCVHGDRGYWEGFVLDDCSNLAVSYCCDGPQWVYGVLLTPESCAECDTAYADDYTDFELCEDQHRTFYYYGLPPGTYYQPIYAGGDPDDDGIYQLRLDAEAARGACCTGPLMDTCTGGVSPCTCEAIGGAYLGDGVPCTPNPCLQAGACCGSNGQGCVEVTGGECVSPPTGYFVGPKSKCDEACCEVPATGADDCKFTAPKTVPVPGYATYYGNSSTATYPCTPPSDPGPGDESWWETFVLEECAEVLLDMCCTTTDVGAAYIALFKEIPGEDCCTDWEGVMSDDKSEGFASEPHSLPICADGGFIRLLWYELTPGTYHYAIHAGPPSGLQGEYFMHVTTTALEPTEVGACCVPGPGGVECVPNACLSWCTDLGGTWLAEEVCEPDPCQLGACCEPDSGCTNTTYQDCVAPDLHHPGKLCADFRCPKWSEDECANAELIALTRGSVQLQGYNAHATARWGLCGTSGVVCLSSNGLEGWDGSCGECGTGPTRCQFDRECPAGTCSVTSTQACYHDEQCPAGTCSVTTTQGCHSDADCPPTETCEGEETCVGAQPCNPTGESCLRIDPFADPYFSCSWRTRDLTGNPPDIGMNTVWYKFVASEPSISIETCSSGLEDPNLYDTALVLYEGECGNLTELTDDDPDFDGCGEDECPFEAPAAPYYSQICYCGLSVGSTYYVEVINSGHDPGQFQLDIEYPCADCLPGACCEFLGNRCYNFYAQSVDADPVATLDCESDADCLGVASTCGAPGDCICLPAYTCSDNIWPEDCSAGNQRYGGNSSTCLAGPEFPQIDPPCGLGACCDGHDDCGERQTPIECVGDLAEFGDSSWLGEGSECIGVDAFEDAECPKACPINGICHPDLTCISGDGHPYDGGSVYLADSSSNGICSTSGTPCDGDVDCLGAPDLCHGDNVQIVADSFIPLDTPINQLCWRGVYMNEEQDDCSTNLLSAGTSGFTIRFWEDTDCDGIPGEAGTGGLGPIAEYVDVSYTRSLSGFTWGVTNPRKEWEFHAQFAGVPLGPSCYFVEITAIKSPNNCDFWIETSTVGDDVIAVDSNADGTYDGQAGGDPLDLGWLMNKTVKADDCLPTNDDCAAVIAGADTNGLSHGAREQYATSYASTDGPYLDVDRCGVTGSGFTWRIENDLWYTYTAECTGELTVDICTSGYDTGLAIYNFGGGVGTSGWICPIDGTYLVGCRDDVYDCGGVGTSGVASRVTVDVTQGDKILISVGGDEDATPRRGCGLLKLDLVPAGAEPCFEDADCQDGLYCNGTDSCNQSTCQCEHSGNPCDPPESCREVEQDCQGGAAVEIESAQSCQDHGATEYCLAIGEGGARDNNVEPRLQLGVPLELEFIATGAVASNGVTLTVSCTPNPFGGTATVVTDGTNVGRVTFSQVLPNKSCCTLTFSGDIEDCWPIVILEGDVNLDCQVSTADTSSVKARLQETAASVGAQYDVNRDENVSTADKSNVKARLQDVVSCPCTCP